jgi:plastocyanin
MAPITIMRHAAVLLPLGAACAFTLGAHGQTAPKVHVVVIEAMRYSPQTLEVNAGDTVIWKNKDPFPHTATATNGSFDSREIGADRSWKFKASGKGSVPYVCTLHPTMKAELVVK